MVPTPFDDGGVDSSPSPVGVVASPLPLLLPPPSPTLPEEEVNATPDPEFAGGEDGGNDVAL